MVADLGRSRAIWAQIITLCPVEVGPVRRSTTGQWFITKRESGGCFLPDEGHINERARGRERSARTAR